jgi:hypothetical protein
MGFRDKAPTAPASPAKPAPAATKAAAAPARPAGGAPAKPGRNPPQGRNYSGLKPPESRAPFLVSELGKAEQHRVRFVETVEIRTKSKKPWLKTVVEIVASDTLPEGVTRTIRKVITDEAFEMSGPEILSMVVAACGFATDDEGMAAFEAENEDWQVMLNAVHGLPEGVAAHGENPLKGMTAIVEAYTFEKEDDNGKAYTITNYSWFPDDQKSDAAA